MHWSALGYSYCYSFALFIYSHKFRRKDHQNEPSNRIIAWFYGWKFLQLHYNRKSQHDTFSIAMVWYCPNRQEYQWAPQQALPSLKQKNAVGDCELKMHWMHNLLIIKREKRQGYHESMIIGHHTIDMIDYIYGHILLKWLLCNKYVGQAFPSV